MTGFPRVSTVEEGVALMRTVARINRAILGRVVDRYDVTRSVTYIVWRYQNPVVGPPIFGFQLIEDFTGFVVPAFLSGGSALDERDRLGHVTGARCSGAVFVPSRCRDSGCARAPVCEP